MHPAVLCEFDASMGCAGEPTCHRTSFWAVDLQKDIKKTFFLEHVHTSAPQIPNAPLDHWTMAPPYMVVLGNCLCLPLLLYIRICNVSHLPPSCFVFILLLPRPSNSYIPRPFPFLASLSSLLFLVFFLVPAAGKSTYLAMLEERFEDFSVVQEPVHKWTSVRQLHIIYLSHANTFGQERGSARKREREREMGRWSNRAWDSCSWSRAEGATA